MSALKTVKTVKNAVVLEDAKGQQFVRLDSVRLSYPFVGTMSDDEDDNGNPTPKYRVTAMLPKATHQAAYDVLVKMCEQLAKDNESKVPKDKWFLQDGDDKEDENMHGHWLVSASDGRIRPIARDRSGVVMDNIREIDETFFPGSWAHVLIRPWFFAGVVKGSPKKYPKRISAGLSSLMHFKNDTRFGSGRIDDEDAWGGVATEDDNDDGL